MRIHGHDSGPLGEREKVGGAGIAGAGGAEPAAKAPPTPSAQVVVISAGASEAVAMAAQARSNHVDRIARVKAALRDGSYKVDLDKLARSIVAEELEGPSR